MPRVVIELVPDEARVRAALAGDRDPADAEVVGVAVDVLRATSTLTVARRNGAVAVVPFAETAAAIAFRDATPGALACGERDGAIVPGFDLGNSPFEYAAERVEGRTLAFASTNGSRALLVLSGCRKRLLGAFVSASAVARACAGAEAVRIVCAGERGQPSPEDLACAGWIARALAEQGFEPGGEATALAIARAPAGAEAVRAAVQGAPHGKVLSLLGADYQRDVAFCATLDALDRYESW